MVKVQWIALFVLMGIGAEMPAMAQVRSTPTELIRGELSFPSRDGWGKPVITRSGDGFAAQLWFSEAPLDGVSAVARRLLPTTRSALTQIEVYRVPGQTVVQVHFRSKARGLFIKRAFNPRGWKLVANLHEPPEVPGVSYADRKLIPSFVTRTVVGALAEDRRNGRRARCELLDEMSAATDSWTAWVALAQADCFRYIGDQERAAEITERLVRHRSVPKMVQILAGLRLEEWPDTYNPWIRQGVSNADLRTVPREVIQELNIRQARKMMRNGKLKMAVNSFVLALNQAILPEEMEWPVHDIRLELMERALREKKPNWAIRLFQNLGLPPEDHPAYLPTLRAAALGYARLGFMDRATALAETVLHPRGAVVDPELTTAVVRSLRGGKKYMVGRELSRAIPTELNWIGLLGEQRTLSASTSLLLAEWLLDVLDDVGIREASRFIREPQFVDPPGAFQEARMAVMMAAKDCEAMLSQNPGGLPADSAAFASICLLQDGSPLDPLVPFDPRRRTPLEENGFFGGIAQSYAEASSEFYSELSEVADELGDRSEQERLRLLEEGKLDLNVSFDDLGLPEPFPEPAPGPAEDLGTAEAMRAASDKIVAAARRLMEEGKLSQDEALREAVRQHARDSASLLEAMSSGEEPSP